MGRRSGCEKRVPGLGVELKLTTNPLAASCFAAHHVPMGLTGMCATRISNIPFCICSSHMLNFPLWPETLHPTRLL